MSAHQERIHFDPVLKWLASCTCGAWAPPMGWASQQQAREAWERHVERRPASPGAASEGGTDGE